jgi:hypothetical protein
MPDLTRRTFVKGFVAAGAAGAGSIFIEEPTLNRTA